jgi:long-chain acyl-CoA synthetase
LAVIIYTSGTTGKSKGAMLTHENIASNVRSCIKALEETRDDRLTLLLPMFHSFMLTVCIFTPLSMGAGIVLIKSVQPFKSAMREIIRNRATILVGIPQLFQALADAKIPFWLHWVLKLRLVVSGAAPLPGETLVKFDRKFRFPLLEGYGLSEASPVVSFNPIHGVRKAGSVGLPLPDIEVKIFDDHGRELPPGQLGEIVVRGPNVMLGYYNQPEETAASLRDHWLHTGDMGKKDDDGYIYIVDRRKEMLLVRGMNVYPREIEEVLHQFPNVREAAVVAKIDEKRGEVPIAFVSPLDGVTLDPNEILRFCRDRLADYKIPREIRVVNTLPRTATGKIAKLELKKHL